MMRIASALLGAALLVWLVASIGIDAIVADLVRIGPRLLVVLALELVIEAFNTLGWWFVLPVAERSGTYAWLYWVRCAGNALNDATPTASLGGEAVKIALLRHRMSSSVAAASLLASRLSFSSAKAIFVAGGLIAVWPMLTLSRQASLALLAGFVLMLAGIAAFAVIQVRGIGSSTISALRRARIPARWIERVEHWLRGVDGHLRGLYRDRTADLIRSMGAHFCGFALGTLQILLLMGWLGLPFDPVAAVGIEAFATLIGFLMVVVPSSLGVQEGGRVLIFAALGLPRAAAMAVGITFRLISLIEIALGLAAWIVLQSRVRGWASQPRTTRDPAP